MSGGDILIGNRLKKLRDEAGMGQKELCDLFNIEQSTLANYENNRRTPKIDILLKIAKYFNVSTDYLLGITETKLPYGYTSSPTESMKSNKEIPLRLNPQTFLHLKQQARQMNESYSKISNILEIEEEEVFNFFEYGLVSHISVFIQIVEYFLNQTNSTIVNSSEEKLLNTYRVLNDEYQSIAYGEILKLKKEQEKEVYQKLQSIATDNITDSTYKTGTDNLGKSYPSNGTEG